jgi:group I intron endonuclease
LNKLIIKLKSIWDILYTNINTSNKKNYKSLPINITNLQRRNISTSIKNDYNIWVYDINSQCLVKESSFKSKTECANYLNISRNTVTKYLDSNKILKNKWVISTTELSLENLSKFLIPSTVLEVIKGELLGDGHLSYDPNKPNINGRLEFTFSSKILHYVEYLKFNVLAPICTSSLPTPWTKKNIGVTGPTQYWFSSKRLPYFSKLYNVWYKQVENKYIKILPNNIENLLTPISIAHNLSILKNRSLSYNKLYNNFSWALLGIRFIHTTGEGKPNPIIPIIIYDNADIQKLQVLEENKGKSGVYRWVNKVNGNSYVGSSVNLGKRFINYYNYSYISSNNMLINKALIKYGYSQFRLEILEYCDSSSVISREQYYINILIPVYNLLKIAGSSLGYKHTEDTLSKFKNRNWSPEQRVKLLEHLKYHNSSPEQKEKSRKNILEYNLSRSHSVEVFDTINKETLNFSSIREAAKAIGCVHGTIMKVDKAFKETGVNKLVKRRYIVKVFKS